jgi:hypothetical protein
MAYSISLTVLKWRTVHAHLALDVVSKQMKFVELLAHVAGEHETRALARASQPGGAEHVERPPCIRGLFLTQLKKLGDQLDSKIHCIRTR